MPFITNRGEDTLGERIKKLIPISTDNKFLVGFFYFSGISELYQTLKKLDEQGELKKEFIKILVGLDVDEGINGIYEYAKHSEKFKLKEIKDTFLENIKKIFNSESLDKKDVYVQAEFFLRLLEEGKIILRKTREPNHSKLYLFKLREIGTPSLFITGSSNLTRAGLLSQDEFNVEIRDYGFDEAEKYFDNLWEKSIEFTPEDVKKIKEIFEKKTFLRKVTPFQAWVYILKTYLDFYLGVNVERNESVKNIFENAGYYPYNYQVEAVLQALKMCEVHRGVILADVVGLGKTVIACTLAKLLNKRGIVISPPHLIGDENKNYGWKKYLEDFKLYNWEVRSIGKLKDALEFVEKNQDIKVVIVDEAHRFRNENTERYHYLHEICRGKIVILLTATPFNNKPSDIFALLKLFTIPKKSTIVYDEDLQSRFEYYEILFNNLSYIKNYHNSNDNKKRSKALNHYKNIFGDGSKKNSTINLSIVYEKARNLAKEIRGIIEPVIIRRNRLDLKYYGEKIDVPIVKDPEENFFELTKNQSDFYDEVIKTFYDIKEGGRFTGAIYLPIKYEKDFSFDYEEDSYLGEKETPEEKFMLLYQKNLYDFMRRLLVKRFESSFSAFKESIENFIRIHNYALEFVERTGKFILNRKLMKEIVETDDDEEIYENLKQYEEELKKGQINEKYHKVYKVNDFKYKDNFINNLQKDKELFKEILKRFKELKLLENDPKAKTLVKRIKKLLSERKIVIFTEYIDTARHLEKVLRDEFGNSILPAYGNLSESTIRKIYKNFDAQYQRDSQYEEDDEYQILVATDKLSEGFNLNRAGAVINYDIPWNPVRVIQRVGRINRIGKKVYDEIFIINFFPTEQGADIVKSKEIAQNKMFMIHKVLGEDAKIFSPDEEPQPSTLYKKLLEYKEDQEKSFFTNLKQAYEEIKEKFPEVIKEVENMPLRVKLAKKGQEDELIVFVKKRQDLFILYQDYKEKDPKMVSFEEIYDKIKVEDKDEQSLPLSDKFWENYYQIFHKKIFKPKKEPRGEDVSKRALYLLKEFRDTKEFEPQKDFILKLIEDIEAYGTLSEHILREIASWKKNSQNLYKISQKLDNLRKEIGKDFLEKTEKYFKDVKETVIIAIENRKENES